MAMIICSAKRTGGIVRMNIGIFILCVARNQVVLGVIILTLLFKQSFRYLGGGG